MAKKHLLEAGVWQGRVRSLAGQGHHMITGLQLVQASGINLRMQCRFH